MIGTSRKGLPIKKDKNVKSNSFSQNVLIHGHCHQKSQDRMKGLKDLLSELNINNKMIDSSCCGMAGSFGYDSKTYETSKKMAQQNAASKLLKHLKIL